MKKWVYKFGTVYILLMLVISFQNCNTTVDFESKDAGNLDSFGDSTNSEEPANERHFPARDSLASIAFEDNYPRTGDRDYNDAVFNFNVIETFNDQDQLIKVKIEFFPRARLAGSDHALLVALDGVTDGIDRDTPAFFHGAAKAKVTRYNAADEVVEVVDYSKDDDIVVIPSTKEARPNDKEDYEDGKPLSRNGWHSTLEVEVLQPELNGAETRENFDLATLRLILLVHSSDEKIDVVDVNKEFINRNGYPFGMVVPTDWVPPGEGEEIEEAYPYFDEYRNWLDDPDNDISPQGKEWFLYPAE